MTSYVSQIDNIENIEMWIKSWKEINYWLELKIDRMENRSIENSSNKLKKIENKDGNWKKCRFIEINF